MILDFHLPDWLSIEIRGRLGDWAQQFAVRLFFPAWYFFFLYPSLVAPSPPSCVHNHQLSILPTSSHVIGCHTISVRVTQRPQPCTSSRDIVRSRSTSRSTSTSTEEAETRTSHRDSSDPAGHSSVHILVRVCGCEWVCVRESTCMCLRLARLSIYLSALAICFASFHLDLDS